MPNNNKNAWRRLIKEIFRLTPGEARQALDALLVERLYSLLRRKNARSILAFAPLPDEPDITPLFSAWIREGGALALPVWAGGENMLIRRVGDPDNQLRPGRAGILEPGPECPETAPSELDLALTPGRAFSENRDRLGRGAGCYDALFRESPGLSKLGVAYDFQVFPALPAGGGDIPVDAVVTPSRTVGEI